MANADQITKAGGGGVLLLLRLEYHLAARRRGRSALHAMGNNRAATVHAGGAGSEFFGDRLTSYLHNDQRKVDCLKVIHLVSEVSLRAVVKIRSNTLLEKFTSSAMRPQTYCFARWQSSLRVACRIWRLSGRLSGLRPYAHR